MTWKFWGKWDEPLLAASFWADYYLSNIPKKCLLPKLEGKIKIVWPDYYYWLEDFKIVEKDVINQINSKNLSFFDNIFSVFDEVIKNHITLGSKINSIDYFNLGVKEIRVETENLFLSIKDLVSCWTIVFQVGFGIEAYLRIYAGKKKISYDNLVSLVNSADKALVTLQEQSFNELFLHIKSTIDVANIFLLSSDNFFVILEKKSPLVYKRVMSYIEEYAWLGTHSFRGKGLTKETFFEKVIEKYKGSEKEVEIKNFSKESVNYEISSVIKIASKLMFFRLHIAEVFDKVNYSARFLFTRICDLTCIPYDSLISLTYNEILITLKNRDALANRKSYGIIGPSVKGTFLHAENSKVVAQISMPNEVKGLSAFKGKALGNAKILSNPNDVSKVSKGDIIVASETTPDFVLAMKKASGFITDQGGITSHAAIIAREMQKPCIVGTKIATKVFKDGDLVELNADLGIAIRK